MTRYFNLKLSNPEVQGVMLKVDPSATLAERVIDMTKCYSVESVGEEGRYKLCKDESSLIELVLDAEGMVNVLHSEKISYLKEVTEEEASIAAKKASYWKLQQGMVRESGYPGARTVGPSFPRTDGR